MALVTAVVALVLGVWLAVVDVLCWPLVRLGAKRPKAPAGGARREVSCVTVSWNGRHFLQQLLPSLRDELQRWGHTSEIVVVDNGSEDGTVEWLQEQWPDVRIVALPENRYFVRGCMAGIDVARFETLVVLNNDMIVEPGFLPALLAPLERPGVFGVSSQIFLQDPAARREETGLTGGAFRGGVFKLAHLLPELDQLADGVAIPTLWAGGGSSAYDARAFRALGGFDTLYDPFYVEDLALSYGAWSRGWSVLFAPGSRVRHAHRGTSRKAFGDRYIDGMIRRNQHLFTWKMVADPVRSLGALATLPLVVLKRGCGSRPWSEPWFELSALLRALPRFPRALVERQGQRRQRQRSDRAIFDLATSIHRTQAALGPVPAERPLNLLFLAGRLPRRGVDGSWVLVELLCHLAARHAVTLLAIVEDLDERELAAPLEAAGVRVELVERRSYAAVANLHHQTPTRLARDYSHPALRAAVDRVLRKVAFDVVQVDYIEMAHVAAPWLAGVPSIYVCHEAQEVAAARGGGSGFEVRRARLHEGAVVRQVGHTVCLSEEDRAVLARSNPGAPLTTIPSAIDVAPWDRDLGEARASSEVLFVGSFGHPPNVDAVRWLLAEIFPRVRAARPEATLRIVGAGPPEDLVAGAPDGVEFAGFVPDLVAAHHRAAVVVVPLRQGGGVRGKVLEAWAGRCAVVGTSVAAAGLGAEDGREMLLADDAAGFAAAVVRCLEDLGLRTALGRAGRRRVAERFSVERQGQAYEAIYRSVVAAQRAEGGR